MKLLATLLRFAGGIGGAWWIGAAAAIAGFLVWQWRAADADRDAWASWARIVCAAAASSPDATREAKRGEACLESVVALAAFKSKSLAASNAILAAAQDEREGKLVSDARQRVADVKARGDAAAQMEEANAQIGSDDHVDRNWIDAVNRAGGLRPR